VQRELVERIVATGTPVVLVVLSGRPYAIDWALEGETAPAAVLQSFFPGEEGATALASVLAGDSVPSGRLPVSLPRSAGAQPYSYLHPLLGAANEITSADSTPVRPFGFGLSYTRFTHRDLEVDADASTTGGFTARVVVENIGDRSGVDVVQLYTHDPVASVTRPVAQLVGYARVELAAGEQATVEFAVPAARLAFSDRAYRRVVEPGALEVWVGPSCDERETAADTVLAGGVHEITARDERLTVVSITS
jgi:beta-glucosidase